MLMVDTKLQLKKLVGEILGMWKIVLKKEVLTKEKSMTDL